MDFSGDLPGNGRKKNLREQRNCSNTGAPRACQAALLFNTFYGYCMTCYSLKNQSYYIKRSIVLRLKKLIVKVALQKTTPAMRA
jgi:hypothetical protein